MRAHNDQGKEGLQGKQHAINPSESQQESKRSNDESKADHSTHQKRERADGGVPPRNVPPKLFLLGRVRLPSCISPPLL